jgi:DNA invertase Pin-like site-specific DNA recombinase
MGIEHWPKRKGTSSGPRYHRRVTEEQAKAIRELLETTSYSLTQIAHRCSVNRSVVQDIVKGGHWSAPSPVARPKPEPVRKAHRASCGHLIYTAVCQTCEPRKA